MKPKWIFSVLLLVATLAAFWFLRPETGPGTLGIRAHSLTGEILAYGPRPPGSEALGKVKIHLAKELYANGWETASQEFERDTPIGKVKFSNLRARLKVDGKDTWGRPVRGILCAHIDSKYFKDKEFLGADDAASACAAVVVIAKHLSETDREKAEQLELVFFDGEEAFANDMTILDGLYGSRWYANTWRAAERKPEFGILLDMIGHKDLSIRIPSDSPEDLADMMFSAAEEEGVEKHFGTAPGAIMDDHLPLNLVGIPTIDIIGDFSRRRWWHTAGDNGAIISAESLSISIRVVLGMLGGLLGE
jgi:glutaminyl-peptide cyclotransferase